MTGVLLVDFVVGRHGGHAAEYLHFLRVALNDLTPEVLAPFLKEAPPAGRVARYRRFTSEMWRAFRRGDTVVFHTPEARDFLVLWALTLVPGTHRGHALLMMRRGAEVFIGRYDWRAHLIERLTRGLVRRGAATLVSDSGAAAEEWERITGHPVPVIALPVRLPLIEGRAAPRTGPLTVALVGLFRAEKGIDRYEEVLRLSRDLEPDVRLFCQVADEPSTLLEQEVTDGIVRMYGQDPGARVHRGHLVSEDYDRALLEADVVVLPYEPTLYTSGTSGLMFDALTAGAIVLSTRIRWGVDSFGESSSIVWLPDRGEDSLRDGLAEAFRRARWRRAEGVPSDLPTAETFRDGWMQAVISARARTDGRR